MDCSTTFISLFGLVMREFRISGYCDSQKKGNMNNSLQSVSVQRFKGIKDAPFDASDINVFIGANNAGKSTLAQIIHFGIGLFQSIELAGRWGNQQTVSVSLTPEQILYAPCVDLYALGFGGKLFESRATAIEFSFVLKNGEKINLYIRKGKNGNIVVAVDNVKAARNLGNIEKPFTIYSPGLAGIARHENFISNGVLLRTIARGDANLVFRNILRRLSDNDHSASWSQFLEEFCGRYSLT